jgi:hypothetical protein
LADGFDKAWTTWMGTWGTPEYSSYSKEITQGPEFDALVAMGTSILPLIVDKLKKETNFFGCRLCEFSITFKLKIMRKIADYEPSRQQAPN